MNEEKFTGKANIYTKYRPTYPKEFIQYLYSQVGIRRSSVIADIGSGTGILTSLLLEQKSHVYGVEPNMDMRKTAEKNLCGYPNYISVNASAEDTGLKSESIDFITVAQAFHWFDRQRFKLECKRILNENGKVILVWNSRDSESELVIENDVINRQFCPNFKGYSGGMRGEDPTEYSDFFKDGVCEYRIFRNDLILEEDGFIGRNLSASYSPIEDEDNYQPYIMALKQLFEKYNQSGYLSMPNNTRSYVGVI